MKHINRQNRSFFLMLSCILVISLGLLSFANHSIPPVVRPIATAVVKAASKGLLKKRQEYVELATQELVKGKTVPMTKVYFLPDNKDVALNVLLGLVNAEKRQIDIAAFNLNHKQLAEELLEAAHRGVKIRIVADGRNAQDSFSKIPLLKGQRNISIYLYPRAGVKAWESLMHHKFIIWKSTLSGRTFLEYGSVNFSQSALRNNQENMQLTTSHDLIKQYQQQFEKLIERSQLSH